MANFTPEDIQKLDEKVKEVGAHLGLKFDEEYPLTRENGWNYYAHLKNGHAFLTFQYGGYHHPNRWEVSGGFPSYKGQSTGPYGKNFSITLSGEKTPEKIAKDIKSRLMLGYLPALEKAEKALAEAIKYHTGKLESIRKVARFLGVDEPTEDRQVIYPSSNIPGLAGVYKIESYDENEIKFEVKTTPEKTIKILTLLMED